LLLTEHIAKPGTCSIQVIGVFWCLSKDAISKS